MQGWNFCPWCGHRIFKHNGKGCNHVHQTKNEDGKVIKEECDCKITHGQLTFINV